MTALITILLTSVVFPGSDLVPWYEDCSEGDWQTAATVASNLLQADSVSVEALAALMISAAFDGTETGMTAIAKAAVLLDPGSALAWTASGVVLMGRGEEMYDRAENALLTAAELDSTLALCWYSMGLLNQRRGDPAAAMTFYGRALYTDDGFLPARLQIGRVLAYSGMWEEALDEYREIIGDESQVRLEALAESALLQDRLGRTGEADSLGAVLCAVDPMIWLDVGRYHARTDSGYAIGAVLRAEGCPDPALLLAEASEVRSILGDHEGACTSARLALELGGDTTLALTVLGESLLELGQLTESEETFLMLVQRGESTVHVHNSLGWISEQSARTGAAVDHYLAVLVLDPEDQFARERLQVIAEDSYDPFMWTSDRGGLSLTGSADLSVEHGNRELMNSGGSAFLSWQMDPRGTSIDLGFGGRVVKWEDDSGHGVEERRTDTGWATLSADLWMTDHMYVQASSTWDRQRFTSRPWQVSSYVAGGLQRWLAPWLWFSPELGVGFVSTKWVSKISEEVMDQFTIYASAGLWFEKPHTFVQQAEISGEVYFPPDSPEDFLSSGHVSLAFRTWEPLYISLGYDVDYTRVPEISTWKKFDTRFYTSLNFNLI